MRSSATASDPAADGPDSARAEPATAGEADVAGPAHVATVSFLASRAVPSGGFWVALAGGMALARVAQRRGAREGYGASIAATLETVAIIGPLRFGVPLTQALSAPILGRLEARGWRPLAQIVVCASIRVLNNAVGVGFFIWVIAGGLDAYAGSYDALAGRFGLTLGERGTLALTAAGLLAWGVFASAVQVSVYRRGLRDWPAQGGAPAPAQATVALPPGTRGRFDPRAVSLAAAVAFGLLLSGTDWPLLAGCAAWLALAWATSRPDTAALPIGLALTALVGGGALLFTVTAGLGFEEALRRAARAALLVLVATWLRAAARTPGMREVARRGLGRLRGVPSVPEAARTLDVIGSEGRIAASGRALLDGLAGVPRRPVAVLDAVLGWVAAEAGRFRPGAAAEPIALHARPVDWLLLLLAAAPAATLAT